MPLHKRLQKVLGLTETDLDALQELASSAKVVDSRTVLIEEGQRQDHGILLVSGWAMRYRNLPDGQRQILWFMIPGDICDPVFFAMQDAIHSIETVTTASVVMFGKQGLLDLIDSHPRIAGALWWLVGREQALLQERLVTLGRQDAFERMADMLWDLWRRCEQVDLTSGDEFNFPLAQAHLADALGLTVVHVNRILRRLREDGLAEIQKGRVLIRDPARLRALTSQGKERRLFQNGPSDGLRRTFGLTD